MEIFEATFPVEHFGQEELISNLKLCEVQSQKFLKRINLSITKHPKQTNI